MFVLLLAPLACTFPVKSGDNPLDSATDDPDTATTEAPSTGTPTTGDPPDDGICGDGEVRGAERCDDGNDDPNDGCDMTCQRSGAEEWIFFPNAMSTAAAIAVAATGQIVVVGDDLVVAVDPGGAELWRRKMPADTIALQAVEIDEQGTIYAADRRGPIHALTANGDDLWHIDTGEFIRALATGHGALYSAGVDQDDTSVFTVRRHDRSTGEIVWASSSPADMNTSGAGLAVVGAHVVAAGTIEDPALHFRRLLTVYDDAGAQQSRTPGDDGEWSAVAATSDGGVALVGFGPGEDFAVGRLDADLAPQWTVFDGGGFGSAAYSVAAGPAGTSVISGFDIDLRIGFIRRYDAAGATMWTTQYGEDEDGNVPAPTAVEFGPDFIVAIGGERLEDNHRVWLRRFSAE